MRRFYVKEELKDEMDISGQDARHISRVLRLCAGDSLLVIDPAGKMAKAAITTAGDETVSVRLIERMERDYEPPVEVWLAQGLPKSDKMELIIQKAVELGVTGIIPMETANMTVRYDDSKKAGRVERWRKIAEEAAKQCGRNLIPSVSPVMTIGEVLAEEVPGRKAIMLYEGQGGQPLRTLLRDEGSRSFLLLIGPEGGFSPSEAELCRKKGATPATLGPRILRTETASIAAAAIVLYERGDLGGD